MKQVFGGIMLGCGILIAGLAGLCTLLTVGSALYDIGSSSSAEVISIVPAAVIFGGIPLMIGLGLFFLGRMMMNSPSAPPPAEPQLPPEQIKRAAPPPDSE